MKRLKKEYKGMPYIVADQRFQETFGQQAGPFLETLKETFPELRQVQLTGDPANKPREDHQLEPLWEILDLLHKEDRH